MKYQILIICCLFMLVASCKTINLYQSANTSTTQKVLLGSIGSSKDFILQNEFNNNAVPSYKDPVKVSVTVVPFNKQSFKIFTKAKALQLADINITYVDSLLNKPKYLQLQIADKVAVIDALNDEENSAVKNYLSHNMDASVLTSISIALSQKDIDSIMSADAVFLMENGLKTYVLQLYNDAKKTQTIQFNQGVVFEYQTSNCCWQKIKHNTLTLWI